MEARPGDTVCEIGCSFGEGTKVLRAALSASCVAATVAAGSLLALDLGQEACDKTATEIAEDGARLVQLGQQPHLCPFAVECADVLDDADVVAAPVGVESEARPWRQRSGRWSHALSNLSATSPYVLGNAGGTHASLDPGLEGVGRAGGWVVP